MCIGMQFDLLTSGYSAPNNEGGQSIDYNHYGSISSSGSSHCGNLEQGTHFMSDVYGVGVGDGGNHYTRYFPNSTFFLTRPRTDIGPHASPLPTPAVFI